MTPLAETLVGPPNLTTLPGQRPLGDVLIPAGAVKFVNVHEGLLNRAAMIDDPKVFSDYDRAHPPEAAALDIIARVCRNPAKNGMGRGPIHVITDFESGQTLREMVTAAERLRAGMAKSAEVSIGGWPQYYTPDDPAWDDAAAVVTAPVYCGYVWDKYFRPGASLDDWFGDVDAAEKQLKRWFPRRRRKLVFMTPCACIYFDDDKRSMSGTPLPVEKFWRPALERLNAGGWQTVHYGYQPMSLVGEHMEVAKEIGGLMREVPAVEVS